jgi:hypothetical protein
MGDEPILRVERGRADPEELAALTVVLLALHGDCAERPEEPPLSGSGWWRRSDVYRAPGDWQ